MTPTALLIAGIIQVCVAPVLIVGRHRIADWLADNVSPLDATWFRVRSGLYMVLGGVAGVLSGAFFIVGGTIALASA
ncbi:hypothetical protein ACFCVO_07995 [Agromyces sp. NPDC056379]|uniref:hypothetical protein n=1 Tax=unclassified Agromyces TaxID=2639701 RepID=UPI0035DA669C